MLRQQARQLLSATLQLKKKNKTRLNRLHSLYFTTTSDQTKKEKNARVIPSNWTQKEKKRRNSDETVKAGSVGQTWIKILLFHSLFLAYFRAIFQWTVILCFASKVSPPNLGQTIKTRKCWSNMNQDNQSIGTQDILVSGCETTLGPDTYMHKRPGAAPKTSNRKALQHTEGVWCHSLFRKPLLYVCNSCQG